MQKRTSETDTVTPVRVVIVTLDGHLSGAVQRAQRELRRDIPGLTLKLHAAVEWAEDPEALARCKADIAEADVIIATMLFIEDQITAVLPDLKARRDSCDAIIGCLAASEVIHLTKLGPFTFEGAQRGPLALLKRLRGDKGKETNKGGGPNAGAQQMAMLRRLPRVLKLIPGKAQDLRAYFITLQYWLAGSDENVTNMVRFLVDRYAAGPRAHLKGTLKAQPPIEYPDVGVYHPRLAGKVSDRADRLPGPDKVAMAARAKAQSEGKSHGPHRADRAVKGTVGLLVMRSYVLAGNTAHYDAVIAALESRGLRVVPAYSSGLDSRPAVEEFFMRDGRATIDCMVSLTGFSLVGGPAYNDARAAEQTLSALDVPYLTTHAVEFQTLSQWEESERGLMPVESTMMVAIPELDGSICPMLFGGRADDRGEDDAPAREMVAHPERVDALAARVERLVTLRRTPPADRRVAMVLFNFPPNAGATGTAAYLSVYASLYNSLKAMQRAGYKVDLPESVDALRRRILEGNAAQLGAPANVFARVRTDDHVKRERWLAEIESQWGPAPGRDLTDGASLFILGAQFGNVFVCVQPTFGYEGDPMRLLFERGFSPTHAFSAFYRYLKEDYGAHAVVHFGMHGALEFMPGKQSGLSGNCWPERLIGDLPNIYLYASNNPSEGALAKRRSGATLVTYLTPSITEAGLHKGLLDLKSSLERYRGLGPEEDRERARMVDLIQAQAAEVNLAPAEPAWTAEEADNKIESLVTQVLEVEQTLIPHGLHIIGEPPVVDARIDLLRAMAESMHKTAPPPAALEALCRGEGVEAALAAAGLTRKDDLAPVLEELARIDRLLSQDHELPALLRALDGRYTRPAPGGDLLRSPEVLPTGRNMHGFDPYRLPSRFAVEDGVRLANLVLERHIADGNTLPETVAMVLWGTDNLKSEGGPIAQALALMGARPRFDGYGRLTGAELVPLETLGRPRIDVVMTLSGIFRDLLPLQTKLLAEAALLAATAEEPEELNYIRKHALAYAADKGVPLEEAALRVFSNADGAYGSNVNQLIDSGRWTDEDELAETFTRRKGFAYGVSGKPAQQGDLFQSVLSNVNLAYQNLESMELGVTTIDHYFDTLGGISKAVSRAKGDSVPVYIGDQTKGDGKVRTLAEQVALETRTRVLNPKWYEGMLAHGYEGVRQLEAHVTNTMGWSATTGQVAPWVYQQLTQTFMLDEEMRKRLAELNPTASARVANRLLEAHERNYWQPDEATLEALRRAGEELEDHLENVSDGQEAA